ncbi:MAG: hypothetical protein IJC87_03630 [Clostridia bacterium]|nr:hypothetical protein [Clostridia bacterium]
MGYTKEELNNLSIHSLRVILRSDFNGAPRTLGKQELIKHILMIQSGEEVPTRSTKGRKPLERVATNPEKELFFSDVGAQDGGFGNVKGVFEKHLDGYGYVRVGGYSFSERDVLVRETFVKRAGLKTGDFIDGECDGFGERNGYVLKNTSFVNGKLVEDCAEEENQPRAKAVTQKLNVVSDDYIVKAIDAFCPIGKGQRTLILSEDNAYATDLVKRLASAIKLGEKDLSATLLLVGAKPEKVEEMKESFLGEVVNVDYSQDVSKAVRICNLVIQSVKNKVKNGENHLLVIDRLSALEQILNAYLKQSKPDKFLPENLDCERFILDAFLSGGNFGEKSLTVLAVVGDLDGEIRKNLLEVSNAVISLKGEGKIRKRTYKIDVKNSWTEGDDVLQGEQKIAKIDTLREQACQSQEKEEEIWSKFKAGDIEI